jgi:predicted methyltransferase
VKLATLAGVFAAGLLAALSGAAFAQGASAPIAASVADPARPAADTALDGARKPAEVMAFIGLKPGDRIVDAFPGPYWDRLFSKVVGPNGKVYMFLPLEIAKAEKIPVPVNGSSPFPNYPNVTALAAPVNSFAVPEPVDYVWIRQNYHDLYDPFMGPADVPAFNKAVFNALKPGGVFVIIDHSRNPADARDKLVFDPSIRGKTDQFVYLFRKP